MSEYIFTKIINWLKVDTLKKLKKILIVVFVFLLLSFCIEKITTKNLPPTQNDVLTTSFNTAFGIQRKQTELGSENIIEYNRKVDIEASLTIWDLISDLDKNIETINGISSAIRDLQNIGEKKGKIVIPKEAVWNSVTLDFLDNEYIDVSVNNSQVYSWEQKSRKFIFFPYTEKNTVLVFGKIAIKESSSFSFLKGSKSFTIYEISTK